MGHLTTTKQESLTVSRHEILNALNKVYGDELQIPEHANLETIREYGEGQPRYIFTWTTPLSEWAL